MFKVTAFPQPIKGLPRRSGPKEALGSFVQFTYVLSTAISLVILAAPVMADDGNTTAGQPMTSPKPAPSEEETEEEEIEATAAVPKSEPPPTVPPVVIDELKAVDGILLDKRQALLMQIKNAREKGIGVTAYVSEFTRIEDAVKSGGTAAEIDKRIESLIAVIKKQLVQKEVLKTQTPSLTGAGSRDDDGMKGSRFLQAGTPQWERVHNPPGNAEACRAAEAAGTVHTLDYNVLMFQDKKPLGFKTGIILGDHKYDAYNKSVKILAAYRMCEINRLVKSTPGVLAADFWYAPFVLNGGQVYTFDMQIIYDARSKNIRPLIEKIQKEHHVVLLKCAERAIRYVPAEPGRRPYGTNFGMSPPSGYRRTDHFPFNLDFEKSDGLVPWSYNDR